MNQNQSIREHRARSIVQSNFSLIDRELSPERRSPSPFSKRSTMVIPVQAETKTNFFVDPVAEKMTSFYPTDSNCDEFLVKL